MKTKLVLGGNFGGMTSAFELKRKPDKEARFGVVSRWMVFFYLSSPIWVNNRSRQFRPLIHALCPFNYAYSDS